MSDWGYQNKLSLSEGIHARHCRYVNRTMSLFQFYFVIELDLMSCFIDVILCHNEEWKFFGSGYWSLLRWQLQHSLKRMRAQGGYLRRCERKWSVKWLCFGLPTVVALSNGQSQRPFCREDWNYTQRNVIVLRKRIRTYVETWWRCQAKRGMKRQLYALFIMSCALKNFRMRFHQRTLQTYSALHLMK